MNIEDGLKHSFIALNFFLHILSSEQKALYDITWAACERTNDKNWLGYQNKKNWTYYTESVWPFK